LQAPVELEVDLREELPVSLQERPAVLVADPDATLEDVVDNLDLLQEKDQDPGALSPAVRLQAALHPWVAFGIMPLFALANAGVSLQGVSLEPLGEHG
jgi:NhaA family Na+:H+ antiporter